MKKKISQFVLKLMGWKIGNVTPEIPKCVIAVAPHTSNMDFIIGKLAYTAIGRNTNFLIKKGWFVFPFNIFFNSIGGIPVDRDRKTSITDKMAVEFENRKKFQLALTPEGTRKRANKWKKGFYFIALKAKVPIALVALDYGTKTVSFLDTFYPTGDVDGDIKIIRSKYNHIEARHPNQFVKTV
ncbi:MAG: 1-acyl-sn-glycerol-3-phosphate acyltransferase [Dysgonamonadaceae bacterium]|nr:1-acyl-sn-glycerol-3-phosphate acyltransferase [Dysgonamonadaceae bacterium]